MKIVTPARDESVEVDPKELHQYLAERGLATVRAGAANTLVAFPENNQDLVQRALEGKIATVRYRGLKELSQDVEDALASTEVVALVAGKQQMREFFSTEGFCKAVKAVASRVRNGELAIPPGAYTDHKHVAIWRRLG